jgi:dTDP-4-dehydrorhamnose reductase
MKDGLSKTLITGSRGSVGSYIDFGIKVDRDDFDITDMGQTVQAINKYRPSVILHLAAETALARCEKEPAHAYLVNGVGTYNLALAAGAIGARMVYVSTDGIFSYSDRPHSETEKADPPSIYGHSKYMGELAMRGILEDYLIVRTSWIFGGGPERDKKFVGKIIGLKDMGEIKAVNDQQSSPTFAKDLAVELEKLAAGEERGIVHVVNDGVASRFDIAAEIMKSLGQDTKVIPVSSDEFKLPEYFQSSGGLVSDKIKLRPWREALKEYLAIEWKK